MCNFQLKVRKITERYCTTDRGISSTTYTVKPLVLTLPIQPYRRELGEIVLSIYLYNCTQLIVQLYTVSRVAAAGRKTTYYIYIHTEHHNPCPFSKYYTVG